MKNILILGGMGRFGQMLVKELSTDYNVTTLSRRASSAGGNHIQADVCEFDGYNGFDTVIDCAAMKDVPKCETQIEECIRTNVTGTAVALRNAARAGVNRFIYISTDMSVEPQSVYGTTKKLADAMVVDAAKSGEMESAVVRFGNIITKTGSIFSVFAQKAAELGYVPVTDDRMTRFMMSAEQCSDFVMCVIRREKLSGEIYAPVCPSYRILDVAQAVAPDVPVRIVGFRPGDMLTVTMVAQAEVARAVSDGKMIRILPVWSKEEVTEDFGEALTSSNNKRFASVEELRELYDSLLCRIK